MLHGDERHLIKFYNQQYMLLYFNKHKSPRNSLLPTKTSWLKGSQGFYCTPKKRGTQSCQTSERDRCCRFWGQSGCPFPENILYCNIPTTHFTLTPTNVQHSLNEPPHGKKSLHIKRQSPSYQFIWRRQDLKYWTICLIRLQERQSRWPLRKTREPQLTLIRPR